MHNNISMMNSLVEGLYKASNTDKGITFIKGASQSSYLSYRSLLELSKKYLGYFHSVGIKEGDELIFQIANEEDFIISFWACLSGGIIPIPLSLGINKEQRDKVFRVWEVLNNPYMILERDKVTNIIESYHTQESFDCDFEIFNSKLVPLEEAKHHTGSVNGVEKKRDNIAFVQFSSGSTGTPKGVVLTHHNLLTNIKDITKGSQITNLDTTLSWVPLTHDLGLIGFHLTPLIACIDQYIMPTQNYIRNPLLWMESASHFKATLLVSPNFGYQHFLNYFKAKKAENWDLSCIRLIFNGAEPISADLSSTFYKSLKPYNLKSNAAFPVYGLAEACLVVTFPPIGEELQTISIVRNSLSLGDEVIVSEDPQESIVKFVNVGSAIENCKVQITDKSRVVLPDKTIGFIEINGDNVTKGYYNNPDATSQHIYSDGWLNTGDLGFVSEGRLVITGREKDIIFVNGQNIYPHDIERIAEEVDGIELGKIAAVGIFDEEIQAERIYIFVVTRKKAKEFYDIARAVKEHVQMTTGLEISNVIPINRIPKTTSGKFRRYRLKEEYLNGAFDQVIDELKSMSVLTNDDLIAGECTSQLNKQLIDIYKSELKLQQVSLDSSFYQLGGSSLKASYVIARINGELNYDLSLSKFLELQTIRNLTNYLSNSSKVEKASIPESPLREWYPTSHQQQMMYVLQNIDVDSIQYNITNAFTLRREIDIDRFKDALEATVRRHKVFATEFDMIGDQVMQRYVKITEIPFNFQIAEINQVDNIIRANICSYDLNKGPLFKFLLIEVSKNEYVFVCDFHHIVIDGSSFVYFIEEFMDCYLGKPIAELSGSSYVDYALWQQEKIKENSDEDLAFWKTYLEKEVLIELPYDFKRNDNNTHSGSSFDVVIPCEELALLNEISLNQNVSLYCLLLSVYSILLKRYCSQDEMVIGTSSFGRSLASVMKTIGMFVNTVPIFCKPSGHTTFLGYLNEMQSQINVAIEHQNISFSRIVETVNWDNIPGRNPIFDTMFVMQNMDFSNLNFKEMNADIYSYYNPISKFDLTVFAKEYHNELILTFEFNRELFKESTIEKLAQHFRTLLKSVQQAPEKKIMELEIFENTERIEVLEVFNNTVQDYPKNKTIDQLFEECVCKNYDEIAIQHEYQTITYGDLNNLSNRFCRFLVSKGVQKGSKVGLLMNRSIPLIASILGVLKSGASYIPIDKSTPVDRVRYMIDDSDMDVLITDAELSNEEDLKTLIIKYEDALFEKFSADLIEKNHCPSDLIYIIYTSGSTGKPKGTLLSHKSVVNYIWWAIKAYINNEKIVFPLYSSISFDLTVTSFFAPLLTGNKMIIYNDDEKKLAFEKIILNNEVDIIKLTPSHLHLLKHINAKESRLKRLIVGGEQLEINLAKEIFEAYNGEIEIYNEYGPTETAVGCMIHLYTEKDADLHAVPIGIPADNVQLYVLDHDLNPVPAKCKGELFIAGDGVSKGYLNRPDLNAEKFVCNPYLKNSILYRTGDLVQRLDSNELIYLGRMDNQVKIRGHRVELSEIEYAISKLDHIQKVIVLKNTNERSESSLSCYYLADKEITPSEFRKQLSLEVPSYMIPNYYMRVDIIPLTANGKIDYCALQKIDHGVLEVKKGISNIITGRVENILLEAFRTVLLNKDIQLTDNYYDIGGDSIKAIQVVSKLSSIGYSLSVKDILVKQTLSEICECVVNNESQYEQGQLEGTVALLPMQKWFFQQKFMNENHYNQSVLLKLNQTVDTHLLNTAFSHLFERHDGLRLKFVPELNQMQYDNSLLNSQFEISEYILENHDSEFQMHEIIKKMKASLDLQKPPLLKCAIFRVNNDVDYLFITIHHLLVDGVSWRIILGDLFDDIDSLVSHGVVQKLKKTASVNEWIQSVNEYWLKNNSEYQTFHLKETEFVLPLELKIEEFINEHLVKYQFKLDYTKSQAVLHDSNKMFHTEPQDLIMSSLIKTLTECLAQNEIVIEMEGHGRHLEECNCSRTVGWFTSMYPVSFTETDECLISLIMKVKETINRVKKQGNEYMSRYYIKDNIHNYLTPEIRFNFLGSFDSTDPKWYEFTTLDTHGDISPDNHLTSKLEISAIVIKGELHFEFNCHDAVFEQLDMRHIIQKFENTMNEIITLTSSSDEIIYTPSDFDTVNMSQSDLDSLFE